MRFEETLGVSDLFKVAHLELRQKIDRALKPLHISFAQYSVLSALEEKSGQTNAELARRCSVTPQSMIRLTQGLVTSDFVVKTASETHGLLIHFALSKKGAKAICDAHVAVDKVERAFVQGLSKTELKRFLTNLKSCIARL